MSLPIVEVEWVDAITRIEQCPLPDAPSFWGTGLRHRKTTGYLVHQDKKRVVLASDCDEPEQDEQHVTVSTFTVLPAGWVSRVHVVRPGEEGTTEHVPTPNTTPAIG